MLSANRRGTQRIDDANLIATGMQGAMELAVPLAGGLDHDQAEVVALEPTFERAMALMAVGDAERLFGGQNMDIEPGFADIDSHARFALGLLFGHILALHAGLAPHHLFRTRAEERMDQALPRGSIPRVPRSPTPNHFAVSRQNQHARVPSGRQSARRVRGSDHPVSCQHMTVLAHTPHPADPRFTRIVHPLPQRGEGKRARLGLRINSPANSMLEEAPNQHGLNSITATCCACGHRHRGVAAAAAGTRAPHVRSARRVPRTAGESKPG